VRYAIAKIQFGILKIPSGFKTEGRGVAFCPFTWPNFPSRVEVPDVIVLWTLPQNPQKVSGQLPGKNARMAWTFDDAAATSCLPVCLPGYLPACLLAHHHQPARCDGPSDHLDRLEPAPSMRSLGWDSTVHM